MKKILAMLLCAFLVLGTGCEFFDFTSASTSSVSEPFENVSSSFSEPQDTSSSKPINSAVSRPQSNTPAKPQKTESIGTSSNNTSESTSGGGSVTINPYAQNHCYSSISSEQQRIYRILYSAIKNVTVDYIWLGNCGENYLADIAVAYRAVTYDYPEFFWVPYSYLVNKEKENSGVRLAFEQSDNDNRKYLIPSNEVQSYKQKFDAAVSRIIKEVENFAKTPHEKVLYLHDLLIEDVTYSTGTEVAGKTVYNDLAYTAYGAIVKGDAVCEGYSKAMSYLCTKMGIENMLVTGTSREQGHMWNLVCLEDKWYHIDTTWDDAERSIDYPLHTYFCVTDEQILLDHQIDLDVSEISVKDKENGLKGYNFSLPSCVSNKYNYFEQKDYYLGDDLAAAGKLIESICRKQSYIELKFETAQHLESFKALDKKGRDTYLLSISKNVVSDIPNWTFMIKQYALIGDCLYIEW